MTDIDLHKEYDSRGESVQDLFDSTEEGFFVPFYQREYTWEEDNINQLFDDLVLGVRELPENDNTSTFLGTTILTTHRDKKQTVKNGDVRAQPTAVQIVIDGQQRISTIALISIQITVMLESLSKNLPDEKPYKDLRYAAEGYVKRLKKLYTIEIGKGADPAFKPKIIRAQEDYWTYTGDDSAYSSPIARYIAFFIRTGDSQDALDAITDDNKGARIQGNLTLVDKWLESVCEAHIPGTLLHNQFPIGKSITSSQLQEHVLGFPDDEVKNVVDKTETDKTKKEYAATATYQLLLLTYYLLRRSGVNRLQPTHEEWGFDMFQALNATGTPLTVMETFLPQVMQAENNAGTDWDTCPSRYTMDDTLELFNVTGTNEQKNLRTNELLGTFSLCYDGTKLGNKFSDQRRWMTHVYEKELSSIQEKREFLRKLSRTSSFYFYAWYMEETTAPNHINGLEGHSGGELASLLIQYLRSAKSKMSATILTRFHSQALDDPIKFNELIEAAKACAAFFTLWRSCNSTSGLDDIYRKYFKGNSGSITVDKHNWKSHPKPVTISSLKEYFLTVLDNKGLTTKDDWIQESEHFLSYTEQKTICRFILFITGHDRVADTEKPGLTAAGSLGSCELLKLKHWVNKDYKSLEHIAPQNLSSGNKWDPSIYNKGFANHIGNLTLLPIELNNIVDNKEWAVKFLYYSHIGVREKARLEELKSDAQEQGVVLSKKATNILSKTKYNCTIEPILEVRKSGSWDADLIERRTHQIKELAWDKLISWLQP